MKTTSDLEKLSNTCGFFVVSYVEHPNVKAAKRVRTVWDQYDFGKWHCEVHATIREVRCSHNHILNDVILGCLQKEYRALELAVGHLGSIYKHMKGIPHIKHDVEILIDAFDKKKVVDWFVSDMKEIAEMLDLEVDIKTLVKERTKHDEELKKKLCL